MVPRMMRARHFVTAFVLVASLAGCSGNGDPAVASSPSVSLADPSGSTTPDGYAVRSCQKAAGAIDDTVDGAIQTLREVADEARQSELQPIADAGATLDRTVKRAEQAKGAPDEAMVAASAMAEAIRFSAACAKAGMAY